MKPYSKQKIFCNACGKEMNEVYHKVIGRECKCCSMECVREYNWRRTLSIMGEEYRSSSGENSGT